MCVKLGEITLIHAWVCMYMYSVFTGATEKHERIWYSFKSETRCRTKPAKENVDDDAIGSVYLNYVPYAANVNNILCSRTTERPNTNDVISRATECPNANDAISRTTKRPNANDAISRTTERPKTNDAISRVQHILQNGLLLNNLNYYFI